MSMGGEALIFLLFIMGFTISYVVWVLSPESTEERTRYFKQTRYPFEKVCTNDTEKIARYLAHPEFRELSISEARDIGLHA